MTEGDGDDSEEARTDTNGSGAGTPQAILRAANSVLNLDLLRPADEMREDISWLSLSYASFYLGVIGLLLWIAYIFLILGVEYIISSQGLFAIGGRVISIGPLAPVGAFLALFGIRRMWVRLQERVAGDNSDPKTDTSQWWLFLLGLAALGAAAIMRGALYHGSRAVLGDNPFRVELIGLMLADLGYVSLLLIGFGAMGAFYFDSPTPS